MNDTQPAEASTTISTEIPLKDLPASVIPVQDFAQPTQMITDSLGGALDTPAGSIGLPPMPTARPRILPQPIEFSRPPSKNRPVTSADGTIDVTYYKGPHPSFRVIFPWGSPANFVKHIYATTDAREIEYLDNEAETMGLLKATGIMDVEELTDPMVAFKNKIIREFLAEQAEQRNRANNPANDVGESDQRFRLASANTRMTADPAAMMAAAANAATPEGGGAQTFSTGNIRGQLAALQARAGQK